MTIRPAQNSDIPAIVELLKISLGESLMPKSEAFWRWKHVDNPFGTSPVLLAEADGKLVGVRAFMRWEWRLGTQIIKAVRAVDTATHPDYQGKGIFKALTLQLVDQCKTEGIDFIFNTPNGSSMPGYLKMGWEKYGRLKLNAGLVFPNSRLAGRIPAQRFTIQSEIIWNSDFGDCIQTNRSTSFYHWRYGANPNVEYFKFISEGVFCVYRIKQGKYFTEFRLVEFKWNGRDKAAVAFLLKSLAQNHRATLITSAGSNLPLASIGLAVGPMITTNPLTPQRIFSTHSWQPTLGDLEVF